MTIRAETSVTTVLNTTLIFKLGPDAQFTNESIKAILDGGQIISAELPADPNSGECRVTLEKRYTKLLGITENDHELVVERTRTFHP